jgi:hypothetical protein
VWPGRARRGLDTGVLIQSDPWIQLPKVTTDRGITAAQTDAAVMARPGDNVAAGDGLVAFGVVYILLEKLHFGTRKALVGQWICGKPSRPGAAQLSRLEVQ